MFYAIDILLKNDKTNEFALIWRLAHQTILTRYVYQINNNNIKSMETKN